MKKKDYSSCLVKMLTVVALIIAPTCVYAMHIMEGYLPKTHALVWYLISAPFVIYGVIRLSKISREHPEKKLLIALAGAFVFLLSSLKLPAMTGSCSHPTGVGLGTVLFGPAPMFVLGTIVLIFQAILLAHGGISTLGANAASMAIAGPIVGYAVFKIMRKSGANEYLSVFLAAMLADLFTYVVTSFQLAIAFPTPSLAQALVKYLSIFALTQVPISIIEGLVTALIYNKVKEYEGGGILNVKKY